MIAKQSSEPHDTIAVWPASPPSCVCVLACLPACLSISTCTTVSVQSICLA